MTILNLSPSTYRAYYNLCLIAVLGFLVGHMIDATVRLHRIETRLAQLEHPAALP